MAGAGGEICHAQQGLDSGGGFALAAELGMPDTSFVASLGDAGPAAGC